MDLSRYAAKLAAFPAGTETGRSQRFNKIEATDAFPPLANVSQLPVSDRIKRDIQEEPEDAHLTGGTRSLSRRLLALNIPTIGVPQLKAGRGTGVRKPRVLRPVTEN